MKPNPATHVQAHNQHSTTTQHNSYHNNLSMVASLSTAGYSHFSLTMYQKEHDHIEDEGDDLPYVAYPNQPVSNDKPPVVRRGGGNTGPKGVLADYADAKRQERDIREMDKRAAMEMIEKMAFTVNNKADHKKPEKVDYEDEEDDEFMKEYRRKRIEEMKQAQR